MNAALLIRRLEKVRGHLDAEHKYLVDLVYGALDSAAAIGCSLWADQVPGDAARSPLAALEAELAEAKERVAFLVAEAHGWQPRLEAALAERDEALYQQKVQRTFGEEQWALREAAEAEVKRLREAIDSAIHNIGVPSGEYPAPIAYAYDVLVAALADPRNQDDNPHPDAEDGT